MPLNKTCENCQLEFKITFFDVNGTWGTKTKFYCRCPFCRLGFYTYNYQNVERKVPFGPPYHNSVSEEEYSILSDQRHTDNPLLNNGSN